ncbi:MAG: histidine ammonia-lyase [Desulfobacterales bacterium]|nr:histidine ammonia-lyase [Desulfobacterales bacterium]MCP4159440.1 histidine ammonia-lyase [Deltaproteobacteria bacterium]
MENVLLGIDGMTLDDLVKISRSYAKVEITEESKNEIQKSRALVEKWVREEKTIYGVTTGFGALSDVTISLKDTKQLQDNILMSHAAGVGNPLPVEAVRAIMALRIKDLAKGNSSARIETVNQLTELLNNGVSPVIPEKGSVGASGDLCPLSHLSLVLLGLGEAFYKGDKISGADALKKCGMKPLELSSGEGLALVNGTQVMTGIGALAVYDAVNLGKMADIAASISLEVLHGSRTEFDSRIQDVRAHPGQRFSANNLLKITESSEIISSHKDCKRIQDAYTLRCSPQVHGASHDAIRYAKGVVETEMNSSTNNPLIFSESEEFLLGGNFHGQPVALAMDFMAIAVAELANISERRIERLVNPMLSGLPAFLVENGGLNSGFMIAQYAAASLVSENKVLAHPACVDSIPTSANKEDHVSMGTISARKCRDIVTNAENVIAIEMLCGAQAMDLFTNQKAGVGTRAAYKVIREHIARLDKDRIISRDIEDMVRVMKEGKIIEAVEKAVGELE